MIFFLEVAGGKYVPLAPALCPLGAILLSEERWDVQSSTGSGKRHVGAPESSWVGQGVFHFSRAALGLFG